MSGILCVFDVWARAGWWISEDPVGGLFFLMIPDRLSRFALCFGDAAVCPCLLLGDFEEGRLGEAELRNT